MNITLDSGHLTMKGTGKVQIKTSIQIYGTGTKMPVTKSEWRLNRIVDIISKAISK